MHAFLLSFGVIFLAELGDKSQLMAMAFATRYRALTVLVAVTFATLLPYLILSSVSPFFRERLKALLHVKPEAPPAMGAAANHLLINASLT